MNPLTLVKRIQNINSKEASLGISEDASWHAKYKDSAYVYVGGIPFDLTEGDLLAVFAQYGEIVDVNLVRDKGTGKSKGFAFVAYEDQRSTILAVDNLNGAQVLGRTIRVDHVTKYKKKEEEDEEAEQQKREARGVCRAFQRGDCTRGAGCKFSHNEQRAANTGWGPQDAKNSRWENDKFEGPTRSERGPDKRIEKEGYQKRTETKPRDRDRDRETKSSDRRYGLDDEDGVRKKDKRGKYDSESYRRGQESERRDSRDRRDDERKRESGSRDHRRKDEDNRVRSHRG